MVKVLFLIHDLQHGGAEKVLVNLVNNIDKTKYEVIVQTLFDSGVNRQYLHSDVKYLPGVKWEFPGNSRVIRFLPAKWLYKYYIKDDYDVIVAFLEGTATKVLSGCDNSNIKKVAWVHIEMQDLRTCFKSSDIAISEYRKFDKIICVSETVRDCFEKAAGGRFSHLQVLYNTNETADILRKSREPVEDIVYDEKMINLISVAKLVKTKGYDRLIPIIRQLREEGYPIHLYLLGIGEDKEKLERLAFDEGITEFVSFLGYKDNPYKYVANADIYVCSSRREGFSTAVTESLIVGTPVVSTCCSGAYELLGTNNEYGIVVNNTSEGIYQGIKQMIDNDQYKSYRLKAAERGKRFCTENTTKAVEDMLENL